MYVSSPRGQSLDLYEAHLYRNIAHRFVRQRTRHVAIEWHVQVVYLINYVMVYILIQKPEGLKSIIGQYSKLNYYNRANPIMAGSGFMVVVRGILQIH